MSLADTNHNDAAWADHEAEILALRGELARELTTAATAIGAATRALATLAGNRVYDVAIADGPTGTDLETLLTAAGRDIRAGLDLVLPD
ncbi:hypothetical protein [Aldersonia kunmingensis]|uniref:hypothetical protein n=1 Tax=Aldersonia kunmingensis TaxID=408066 RepID=UPI0008316246|nr:hypothetical protein [Aldersonia kunmingensis]